jgi:hypothetical protein
LLAVVVKLLPAGRRDWGRAMRAESAAIEPGRERWTHALSCARAVCAQPTAVRAWGYPLLTLAGLAGVLTWSHGIGYVPLRLGVVATVALLLGVAWWGRRPGVLGPVADSRMARAVRAGGCLLVGALTATFASAAGTHGPPADAARTGVPLFAAMLTSCLIGFLALTAQRTAVTARALAAGVAASFGVAGIWGVTQLAFPPLPADIRGAVIAIWLAVAAVVLLGARQQAGARDILLAVLFIAILAPLLVFVEVLLLSSHGPAWLIPDLVPMALSPADDLANSRIEIQDPYMAMLLVAWLSALALTCVAIAGGRTAADSGADADMAADPAVAG